MWKHTIASLYPAVLAAFLVTVGFERTGVAADAVFTQDGKLVYFMNIPRRTGTAAPMVLDVTTGQSRPFIMPKAIQAHGDLEGLARSKSGFLLFLYSDALWAYDPVKETSAKVCAAEPGNAFYDVACEPVTGQVGLAGKTGLGCLEAGTSRVQPVSVRRVDQFRGLTFLQKDHVLFSARGDAWLGRIKDEPADAGRSFKTLLAYRFAPVATLETGNYSPAEQGAAAFAASRQWLYVHLLRMGGSGDGILVRMPLPESTSLNDEKVFFSVKGRAEATAKTLASMEVVGNNGYSASLCVSPDGTTVFYRIETEDGDLTRWLAKDGEPPHKLP